MAVPDFQTFLLPLLELTSDQQEHSMSDATDYMAKKFNLSDLDRNEMLPSGQQRRLDNRIGWARSHLTKAGLVETTRTSHFRITQLGLEAVAAKPEKIDLKYLDQFPGHAEFRKRSKGVVQEATTSQDAGQTPREAMEYNYQKLREDLAQNLLDTIKRQSPTFFERLVVDLLVKMGYGGSIRDAGQAIGKSGDEGIDGIIKEDKLGLDIIYIQPKKWDGPVSRPEIQKLVGALAGQRARKGVFITTSTFTGEARGYVRGLDTKIVLIDGEELAQLMIDHNVGITNDSVYEIKKIDADYFVNS